MRKIFIFDFDGTFYSGDHKFDNVKKCIDDNKRMFLSKLNDEEYSTICNENPRWVNASTGNDITRCLLKLKKKYPQMKIDTKTFYDWQNDFIYDIILDFNQVIDSSFLKNLCEQYSVYVVSNSSIKHICYYMDKLNIDIKWFKKVIGNEFLQSDPTKEHYYEEILKKEKAKPYNVYVLGDSVESDLTPALHLGMNAFYVSNAKNIGSLITSILDDRL